MVEAISIIKKFICKIFGHKISPEQKEKPLPENLLSIEYKTNPNWVEVAKAYARKEIINSYVTCERCGKMIPVKTTLFK
jgi:hypothetical protein